MHLNTEYIKSMISELAVTIRFWRIANMNSVESINNE